MSRWKSTLTGERSRRVSSRRRRPSWRYRDFWRWEPSPPESLARRYVADHTEDIEQTFRDWKDEECAQISQEIWEAYHGDREVPYEYIHQSRLFEQCFEALDALDKDDDEADKVVDHYAEEIFDARA